MISLEFLVPVYERIGSAVRAVDSVLSQMSESDQYVSVSIVVRDDASPGFTDQDLKAAFGARASRVSLERNPENMGMSSNIRKLVADSSADFVSILTDDDQLEKGALLKICHRLSGAAMSERHLGSILSPRYCYSETGDYLFTTDRLFDEEQTIFSGSLSAIRYCSAAHVLTGVVLMRRAINLELWKQYERNAYFPIIYFGDLLLSKDCLYVPDRWFKHTVYNHCYWHEWGASPKQIQARLNRDYVQALQLVDELALVQSGPFMIVAHRAIIGQHFNRLKSLTWRERMMALRIARPHFFFHALAALLLALIRDILHRFRQA